MLRLVVRSLTFYWRTNLAVLLGVAAAVSVLGGALLVGDSVRGSLRGIAVGRLGRTDVAVMSSGFFRDALAGDIGGAIPASTAPLIIATGFVTHEPSGRRAANVAVYGVDERFWTFHKLPPVEGVVASPALARELGATASDVLLARLQKPSAIPIESLFGRKDEVARTLRLTLDTVLPRDRLGEFALRPQQSEVRALFVPLRRVQRDLGVAEQANTVLVGEAKPGVDVVARARTSMQLEDLGVTVNPSADGTAVIVTTQSGIVGEDIERAVNDVATRIGQRPMPVFTYLANAIRRGDKTIPYSLITALDTSVLPSVQGGQANAGSPAILLNSWAAHELDGATGPIEIDYYLWDSVNGLTTRTMKFDSAGTIPIGGLGADRQLAPQYPGITEAATLADWDPPFPIDLSKVRKVDEDYWAQYRATPKAFIPYEVGRDLWRTRYGDATSFRFAVSAGTNASELASRIRGELRQTLRPEAAGVAVVPVRAQALAASTGATDFGEYFTYFSFFIVVSALLLTVLFFRLGVEQRLKQIGVLRAAGFTLAHVRRLLLAEGLLLAIVGSVLGAAGALGYAWFIIRALTTWWVGAVGTTLLSLHVTPVSLAIGVAGGIVAAALCIFMSLRGIRRISPRALLTAQGIADDRIEGGAIARRSRSLALVFAVVGAIALAAGFADRTAQAGAFFGGGAALLTAALFALSAWLRARDVRLRPGSGAWAVSRLGFRNAAARPGRSVMSAALIASAAFIVVSVDAFRKDAGGLDASPHSGTGGFALLATSEVPLLQDPNTPEGRDALIVSGPDLDRLRFMRFRLRPGDDASCLNLYRPTNPTIVAPEPGFIDQNRFAFASSMAETVSERANPWLLLRRALDDGAVPVIADATSLQYVLHASVGDTFAIDTGAERPLTLKFVGALSDSVLQGQLVMSEENFTRLFPAQQGYRFFLIDLWPGADRAAVDRIEAGVEKAFAPFGLDVVSASERLAAFHQVENTYLSTFQALGGLGLLLGTIGLAAVLFRNVLERRREMALLRAVGYNRRDISVMILAEAILVLGAGLASGAVAAAIAIAPAWLGHGGSRPGIVLALLLVSVATAGLISSMLATRAALRGRMLDALRSE